MSNLAEHDAEQAAITAMCEAGECDHPECQKREFSVLLGVTVRAYGHATVMAKSAAEAAEILRTAAVDGTGAWDAANDVEWDTACEPSVIHIEDESGNLVVQCIDLSPPENAHGVISAEILAEMIEVDGGTVI